MSYYDYTQSLHVNRFQSSPSLSTGCNKSYELEMAWRRLKRKRQWPDKQYERGVRVW